MKESSEVKGEPTDEQIYSALSFCVLLIIVGIPLWWKTTEVYRVSLPYNDIDVLHLLDTKIHVNIHVVTVDKVKGEVLINDLKNIFRLSKLYTINFVQHLINKALVGSSKTLEEVENKIKHPHFAGSLQLFEVPGLIRFTPSNIVLRNNRTIYFSSDTDSVKLSNFLIKKILNEDFLLNIMSEINLPIHRKTNVNSGYKIPPSSDYDVLFTIINPDPDSHDVIFDISNAVEKYVNPLVRGLSDINQFHVKSQWLYFVNLNVQPKFLNYTEKGQHFALSESLLPHIITPLEKKLGSQVSEHSCLNFVLYVPPCSASPLQIYTKNGFPAEGSNAFISPKWGGVQIYNPDREACRNKTRAVTFVDSYHVMPIFLHQLRLLLGIYDVSEAESNTMGPSYIRLWEKDLLIRTRTVEQLTIAKLTLQSLSKLLGKINNIVINNDVGKAIHTALENIYKTTEALKNGKLHEAFNCSKRAFLSSEKAFTDPTLLALLYFPDDQKYAVYVPLFLPIMIPVIVSIRNIIEWAFRKFRQGDS